MAKRRNRIAAVFVGLGRAAKATVRKLFLSPVDNRGGWWPLIRESFAGAWQQNVEINVDSVLAFHSVFACITRIAADVGKLWWRLVEEDKDGIWSPTSSPSFSPVLRKPNRYQNHIQFKEWWIISKLIRGNAYALKERDGRGVVVALYLLDPSRVTPLIAVDGGVYYRLGPDNLSGIKEDSGGIVVPASEIIHDRFNCLFHPLVGLSPIFACGLAAMQGIRIQTNQALFFGNMSRPSGILTAPGNLSDETATELKAYWSTNFTGENAGKIAVVGDGLKYEKITMTAEESQLIDQLKWSAENVCSCFHMPAFKIGVGAMPTYQNGEILNQIYYSDCLQAHIESMELCMDEGLGLDKVPDRTLGVELDLEGLLRMDSATKIDTLGKAVNGSIMTTDEARKRLDLKPVPGGDKIWRQQQYYSLEALDERDKNEPFAKPAPTPPALPAPKPDAAEEEAKALANFRETLIKGLEGLTLERA